MTRPSQKADERRFVEGLLDGLISFTKLDFDCERPDCRVIQDGNPPIGIEVVTYHPLIHGSVQGRPRVQIESQWWNNLLPMLETERRNHPALMSLMVRIALNEPHVVHRRDVETLGRELIQIMLTLADQPDISQLEIGAGFVARSDIARMSSPRMLGDFLFLPKEEYPLASQYVKLLRAKRVDFLKWPPITSLDAQTAWLGEPGGESVRTIQDKVKTAGSYKYADGPLWLLVVFETHGDLQSHVMPHTDAELAKIRAELQSAGVDLDGTVFSQIWLYSAASRERRRLFPPQ